MFRLSTKQFCEESGLNFEHQFLALYTHDKFIKKGRRHG
jgi:hypothetical protein